MNFGFITTSPCVDVPATIDPRCSDAAFALANPGLCPAQTTLILKPGLALVCTLGSIQFRAFTVVNGVETDVTDETVFTSSDTSIALVGARSGNCTGIAQGSATISGAYEALTATADMNVMGTSGDCCSSRTVAMMVLIDNSRSMSQGFSGSYATRLDFAKAAAVRFIGEVNELKDLVGLISFNLATTTPYSVPTSSKGVVGVMVPGISQTSQKTGFYSALESAITDLNAASADLNVIVLMSDGEDTSSGAANGYQGTDNPVELLSDFKDQGGVVICLGCRASGRGFSLLSLFSTGGFFINAYPGIETESLDFLSGLKGYICAGNCTPDGDEIVATPELDFTAFTNWTVSGGSVDLLGPGLFDFLPGNGLYVDLAGSSDPSYGIMTSTSSFSLESGHTYRISVTLAGNQRQSGSPYSALLRIFYGTNEVELLRQTILINDHTQDFHDYSFSFTAPADVSAKISIEQFEVPSGLVGSQAYVGLLLGNVRFEDMTDLVTLLNDNFDGENEQYVPPRCGLATTFVSGGYAVGYNCYGVGCLDEPPPVQLPDPNPLSDIESGYQPPQEYSSTQLACASCASGSINFPTSTISEAALVATVPDSPSVPDYYTSLTYDLGSSMAISAYKMGVLYEYAPTGGWTVEGSNDLAVWVDVHTIYLPPFVGFSNAEQTLMFPVVNAGAFRYWRFTVNARVDLEPTGFNTVEFYAQAEVQACETATRTSSSSQAAADTAAHDAALDLAEADLNCQAMYSATEQYIATCPIGSFGTSIQRTATAYSLISADNAVAEATAAAREAAEAVLDCGGSNNDHLINVPAASLSPLPGVGPADPYPSIKWVENVTGSITKVTVTLTLVTHQSLNDVAVVLIAPDGTAVWLMQFGAGMNLPAVKDVTLTFDDDGVVFTAGVSPTTGSYQPYADVPGSASAIFPEPYPGPATPQTALSAFIGADPNGAWSLWVCDTQTLLIGNIGGGWDMTITTA